MQEECQDWYELGEGCCLLCEEAYEGCLCKDCNCSKCYWYEKKHEYYEYGLRKGFCEKAIELKEDWESEHCPQLIHFKDRYGKFITKRCNRPLHRLKDDDFADIGCESGEHYFKKSK